MYGGILQDPNDPRNNFFNFLRNSNVTILSNSSVYGIIFKIDINNTEYKSPYSMFRTKNFGERVKTLVLKICPLTKEYKKNRDFFLIQGNAKKTTTVDDFLREYYAQIFIALDTCKYLETICPFPVYIDFFRKTAIKDNTYFEDIPTIPDININDEEGSPTDYMFDDKECLDIFKSKFKSVEEIDDDSNSDLDDDDLVIDTDSDQFGGKQNIIEQLIHFLNDKYDYLGVIAMEIADGYRTLKTFIDNPINYRIYQNFARYEIISLALEQRILHGDFHNENILINPDYEGYFNGKTGKAMLIDFGIVNQLPEQEHDELKSLILQNKYTEAINKIYHLGITEPLWDYPGYLWFKNVTQEDINELILLIQQRQQPKKELEDFSRQIRISDPATKYPLIPLDLKLYQKYLPKMSYELFFKGGSTLIGGYDNKFFEPTGDKSAINLMEDVFKTISFGINSLSNISKKIYNIKSQAKLIAPKSMDVPKMINTEIYGNNDITVGVGGKIKINTRKRKYKKNTHKRNRKYKNKKYTSKRKYK
jgi:hypothetical protein